MLRDRRPLHVAGRGMLRDRRPLRVLGSRCLKIGVHCVFFLPFRGENPQLAAISKRSGRREVQRAANLKRREARWVQRAAIFKRREGLRVQRAAIFKRREGLRGDLGPRVGLVPVRMVASGGVVAKAGGREAPLTVGRPAFDALPCEF